MNEKSYVTMEQLICPVCGKEEDSGAILMDKRLRERFERTTTTGWGLCKEHQQQSDDGYVFLVAAENKEGRDTMDIEEDVHTGPIAAIRKEVFIQLFNVEPNECGLMFCDQEVIERLQEIPIEE